ncbi:SEC-C metal-binding domain-containing protein [Amycolatopsis aidingensis]|uniref:SEC-C metal-binding domain-containing protein n=1 Tax=Amycolatopsis aidingensis TaxID=2842453 RepID=UPI001C0AC533|nr:SEC-C metal-binding domain-containing protein [Amycolatopsis aidingensis]
MNPTYEEIARDCELAAEQNPEERAQCLIEAADYWHIAGNDERARELYERLLAEPDRGGAEVDPRVSYASFLVDIGDRERARELLDDAWKDGELDAGSHEVAGEVVEHEFGDLAEALRWFTRGIVHSLEPGESLTAEHLVGDLILHSMVGSRRRVREAMDQPPDDWDKTWETAREAMPLLRNARDDDDSFGAAYSGPVAVLYWRPEEFAEQLRRWPTAYADFRDEADPHLEHRRGLERFLRSDTYGTSFVIVTGTVAEFAEHAAERGEDPAGPGARASYGAELARRGAFRPWPPGRNEPCWCESGRKYKKCCGAPGSTD